MRLLITGGCGFLGFNLAKEGIKVLIYDNLSKNMAWENMKLLKSMGGVSL